MRILVTGSAGRIGRELVKSLLEARYEVRSFDRAAHKAEGWEHLSGDLRDLFSVRRAVQGVDAVVHLGAVANDGMGTPEDLLNINVQGTLNVLLACQEAGVGRLVNFSSVNALGVVGGHSKPLQFPVRDDYPRHPQSNYQLSKHLGEEACKSYSAKYGIVTICLRPVSVTGGGSGFSHWLQNMSQEQRNNWFRSELCAYVDVKDVCDAVLRSLTVENISHACFLLNADDMACPIPTTEMTDAIHPEVPWVQDREAYFADKPFRSLIDSSAAKEVLGWRPKVSWRDPR